MAALLSRYFGFAARNTDLGTEVRAGVTTFMVMAYIIFVNPVILGFTGVPLALAAGMGLNAVVAFEPAPPSSSTSACP